MLVISFVLTMFYFATRRRGYIVLVVVLTACALGVLRFSAWDGGLGSIEIRDSIGKKVTVIARIVDEPDEREKNTQLTVRPLLVNDVEFTSDELVLVFAPKYPKFSYGDIVEVSGSLKAPEPFGDEGKNEFDYPMYLASKNIHALVFHPSVTLRDSGQGSLVFSALFRFKSYFLENISEVFPEPHGALLSGLILGGKQSLGQEWLDIFKHAGIVHIVVLSGYNMTIVSQWLVAGFRFLGFYGSLSVGTIGIVLFTLMTGAGATVVRAAIMAIIALVARATGRTYTMGRALLLAAVFMVVHNPSILLYDPSFQLSFLASLGLVYVSPLLEKYVIWPKKHPVLREVIISTLATQFMVLPLLLYQTGLLSLVALPVNMLVLPLIPLTMLFGFIAGIVAIVVPPLATVVAIPGFALLSYILLIAKWSVAIPLATVSVVIGKTALVLAYAGMAVLLVRAHRTIAQSRSMKTPRVPSSLPPSEVVDKK